MLDIKFIKENKILVREAARKKHMDFDVEKLLELDEKRRSMITEVEAVRAQVNATSAEIAKITDQAKKESAIESMREVKESLSKKEASLKKAEREFEFYMFSVPNIPDPSVPEGASDEQNVELRKWGKVPQYGFDPRDHITLMRGLDMVDFERGVKVSGFRGYILKGDAVLLEQALLQFTVMELSKKGLTPLIVPSLARENNFVGTGWLPQGKDEVYGTQDNLYLVGTAEVSTIGMYADEILGEEDLPKKFVALSPCFRREAGSYGKDTKGLYRVHEFAKVEQVVLCRADHMESVKYHEELTKNAEEIMQALGLHYRVVVNCGGDLGLGQVKKYDIEAWIPSRLRYGETHSASYFHDFQSRRMNIRYRSGDGTMRFVHTLNNTGVAVPRIMISILEQYQREDGSVAVPDALRPIMGKDEIRSA